MLLIGIMATSVFASANASNKLAANANPVAPKKLSSANGISIDSATPDISPETDIDELKALVPDNYAETETRLPPQRTRFLLYTNDGKHIMWGYVGNGYFVGTDNLGKRCWGIYGNGVFAGFYDGEFFWGRYRSGHWKAEGLFGLNYSRGKYILFPSPSVTP